MRMMSTEDESEATTTEMDDVSVRFRRCHDAGRLQKESGAPTAATTARDGRAHCFPDGQSEHRGKGPIDDPDLADQQRHRREHRRDWRGATERVAVGDSVGFD